MRISVAGRRLPVSEIDTLVSVDVRMVLGQPAQCVIIWRVDDTPVGQRVTVEPGDPIRVEIGGQPDPLFVGETTVVEHSYGADASRELRIRAYDALHRLRKRQATRVHKDADMASLATTLTAGTGLRVISEPIRLGDIYQCARTDLDLLVAASHRVGLFPVVHDGALRMVSLAGDGEPSPVELGMNLHSADLEVSQEGAFRRVTAIGWDPETASSSTATAGAPRSRAAVRADPAPGTVGGGGDYVRADEVAAADLPMLALAQSDLDSRSAAEVAGLIVADGDSRMRPGRRLQLVGVEPSLEGVYTVCESVHSISGTGYETTVSTHPPAPPARRVGDLVTLGVVERVDDPESRARAVVRLPGYADLTTGWAPVLVPSAGPGKGLVVLPDVADTVLVLLPAGDPHGAIVLGGLYGTQRTPDHAVGTPRGGRYSVQTRDGQRVTLDEQAHTVALVDGHGSSVELGPDLLRITAATDLLVEAPGRSLRIRAATVDFEEAP